MDDNSASLRTRSSLLEAIKNPENHRRWSEFFNRYAEFVRSAARKSSLREDEVEDVLMTVMLGISRKIGEFNYNPSKGRFRSYLWTIARRKAIEQYRKRKPAEELKVHRREFDTRTTGTLERELARSDGKPSTEWDEVVEKEWKDAVLQAALDRVRKRVSAEQFQIFDAYVIQDWPVDKVVAVLGVTDNQVYSAKSRIHPILDKEVRTVARQMDNPDIPPEHPGVR